MGPGEDAYSEFSGWFAGLDDVDAAEFAVRNPEPEDWQGWYERVRTDNWD